MKKLEYIEKIKKRMESFPEEEVRKSIDYFSEMIDDRIEDGMSEDQAVEAVGSVDEAVKELLENIPLSTVIKAATKPKRKLKAWEIVLLVLGFPVWFPLFLLAVILLVVLYILLWVCVIVFFAADLAIFLGGIAALIAGFAGLFRLGFSWPLLMIGAGLVLTGGALMLLVPLTKLAKVTGKLAGKIVLWIKSWFVRRKKNA